jgi:hypothetical protein
MWHFSQPLLTVLAIILIHKGAITVEDGLICNCITVYPNSSIHKSSVPSKIKLMQVLKQKCVVLTLK